MSKIKKIMKFLGLAADNPPPLPKPAVPPTPAPTAITDTAQDISLGGASVANQRVSDRAVATKKRKKTTDILGGLGVGGSSGLNI